MSEEKQPGGVVTEVEVPTLADWIRFLRRHWLLILGCSLGAATLVAIVLVFLFPPEYEASATVVVLPPQFSSSLKPEPISVQGYQRLLESDAVIGETARRLVEEGILDESETERLRARLHSRIFVAPREEQTALAPVMEVRARADDAGKAASIANTWAETFLDSSDQLFRGAVDRTASLIEGQYEKKREEVRELERQVSATSDEYQERIDAATRRWDRELHDVQGRWDRQLAAHRKETEQLVSGHQLETRTSIEALVADRGMAPGPGDDERGSGSVGETRGAELLDGRLGQVVTLRIQLAQTPQYRSTEQSISDDSLWQAMAMDEAEMLDVEPLLERTLHSREPNPLYNDLSLRVAEAETELDAVSMAPAVRQRVRSVTRGVEELQRQRSAGLANLTEDRSVTHEEMRRAQLLELAEARRQRERELDALERERERELGDLRRGLDHRVTQFEDLAANYEEALLARAEEGQLDVRIGSPAVPALSARSGHLMLASAVALFFGAVVGLLLGVARDVDVS